MAPSEGLARQRWRHEQAQSAAQRRSELGNRSRGTCVRRAVRPQMRPPQRKRLRGSHLDKTQPSAAHRTEPRLPMLSRTRARPTPRQGRPLPLKPHQGPVNVASQAWSHEKGGGECRGLLETKKRRLLAAPGQVRCAKAPGLPHILPLGPNLLRAPLHLARHERQAGSPPAWVRRSLKMRRAASVGLRAALRLAAARGPQPAPSAQASREGHGKPAPRQWRQTNAPRERGEGAKAAHRLAGSKIVHAGGASSSGAHHLRRAEEGPKPPSRQQRRPPQKRPGASPPSTGRRIANLPEGGRGSAGTRRRGPRGEQRSSPGHAAPRS